MLNVELLNVKLYELQSNTIINQFQSGTSIRFRDVSSQLFTDSEFDDSVSGRFGTSSLKLSMRVKLYSSISSNVRDSPVGVGGFRKTFLLHAVNVLFVLRL